MESGKEVRETTRSRSGPVRIGSRRRLVNAAVRYRLVHRVCHSHISWTKFRGPHKGKVKGEQDNVHFKDGSALNKDGTWKHGNRKLTNDEKAWLQKHGWKLPRP